MTGASGTGLRPLGEEDVPLVQPLAARAFDDLATRQGRTPRTRDAQRAAHYRAQHAHLLRTGRGLGAWADGALVGVALTCRRGDVDVLALLVVEPGAQGAGTGSALLRTALAPFGPRRLLHASDDARALRAYARAGFRLLPALEATGTARPDPGAPVVVDAPEDLPALAPFAVDLPHLRAGGGRVLQLPGVDDALAVLHHVPATAGVGHGGVGLLSAPDAATAADLLRGVLAVSAGPVQVGPLPAQESWAVPVVLQAGLDLAPTGPVAVAGLDDRLDGPVAPNVVYV